MLNTIALYIGYLVMIAFGFSLAILVLRAIRRKIDKKYPSPEEIEPTEIIVIWLRQPKIGEDIRKAIMKAEVEQHKYYTDGIDQTFSFS
jgi:hypothetical protein